MKNILLVEDDPLIVEIYTTKLKESGFEVEVASNGEEALEKLRQKKFDLMVLDVVLPHLTGFEVLKAIKKKKMNGFKIMILSNLGQKSNIELAERLGATKYLIKAHYTPSETVEEIKNILGE